MKELWTEVSNAVVLCCYGNVVVGMWCVVRDIMLELRTEVSGFVGG